MNILIKLYDRPTLARSFKQYEGKNLIELIAVEKDSRNPPVVTHHVKYYGWQLSELAKQMMPKKAKV